MRSKVTALAICAVVGVLCLYMAVRAVDLFRTGQVDAALLGLGVLLLVGVGGLLVVGEVRFGLASQRLGEQLAQEGGLPALPDDVERLPSGRITKETADRLFEGRRSEVEAAPEDWRAWFRLADAYGLARDTPRGRRAMRTAIRLEQAERRAAPVSRATSAGRRRRRATSGHRCLPRRRPRRARGPSTPAARTQPPRGARGGGREPGGPARVVEAHRHHRQLPVLRSCAQ